MSTLETTAPNATRTDVAALARRYDHLLIAVDDDGVADLAAVRFAAWMADWWRPDGPAEPSHQPDAISADRHGVMAARWYATEDAVRVYLPGTRGCYRIPRAAPVPIC